MTTCRDKPYWWFGILTSTPWRMTRLSNAIDAVEMLSYREDGKEGLSGTMNVVASLLEENADMIVISVDVGADEDAAVFDLGLLGMLVGGGNRVTDLATCCMTGI